MKESSQSYPALSIIFPVYNERDSIEAVLKEWKIELQKLKVDFTIIICEDGSKDGTAEFLRKIQKKYRFIFDHKDYRRGYGGAVIDGIKQAKTPYILCVDSDGQCDPKDLKQFLKHREVAEVIIGRRTRRADKPQRLVFSNLFRLLFISLFGNPVHDPSTPYVLFRKKTILPFLHDLTYMREGFWWGFVAACVKRKITLYELPVNHRQRLLGDTQVYHLGKLPRIVTQNALGLIKLRFAP